MSNNTNESNAAGDIEYLIAQLSCAWTAQRIGLGAFASFAVLAQSGATAKTTPEQWAALQESTAAALAALTATERESAAVLDRVRAHIAELRLDQELRTITGASGAGAIH